ncbi:cfem domain-containing [Fusarium longipes]|uniref:Cfem domain-containing n=1 Tax=Fusarium longipes TaxID=694270 RepID=A0A395TAA9_9HYPO|nr:cfem domain-containing [Fusarium longipes]
MLSLRVSALFTSIMAITAQATTTVSSPTQTSLPALASQVPSCVAGCLGVVHESIGCEAGDIVCLCIHKASVISKVGLCIIGAQCNFEDATGSTDIVRDMCDLVAEDPGTAVIASASKVLGAVVASATLSAESAPTSTNGAGSVAYDVVKVVVVGAAAAFAV